MKKIIDVTFILSLADQIIKMLIDNYMNLADSINIIPSFFRITYLKNIGVTWSMFTCKNTWIYSSK